MANLIMKNLFNVKPNATQEKLYDKHKEHEEYLSDKRSNYYYSLINTPKTKSRSNSKNSNSFRSSKGKLNNSGLINSFISRVKKNGDFEVNFVINTSIVNISKEKFANENVANPKRKNNCIKIENPKTNNNKNELILKSK